MDCQPWPFSIDILLGGVGQDCRNLCMFIDVDVFAGSVHDRDEEISGLWECDDGQSRCVDGLDVQVGGVVIPGGH